MEERKFVVIHCQCPNCQQPGEHPDKLIHSQMNEFIGHLDERQKRWFAALEAQRIGYGGDKIISKITGISEKTIREGHKDVEKGLSHIPIEKKRKNGGGRILTEKKISSD